MRMKNGQVDEGAALKTVENPWKRVKINDTVELFQNVIGILNKITPEKFNLLMAKFLELPINTEERIIGVVDLIFIKAVREPIYSAVYAKMCKESSELEVRKEVNGKEENINLRNLLVSKCQSVLFDSNQDFLRSDINEISQCTNNERKRALEILLYDKERIFRKGNARFFGELYKLDLVAKSIVLGCIKYLLEDAQEMSLECLSILLTTAGSTLEQSKVDALVKADKEKRKKAKTPKEGQNAVSSYSVSHCQSPDSEELDEYFEKISKLAQKNEGSNLSTRMRFMMQDLFELRQRTWMPRRRISYVPVPKPLRELQTVSNK